MPGQDERGAWNVASVLASEGWTSGVALPSLAVNSSKCHTCSSEEISSFWYFSKCETMFILAKKDHTVIVGRTEIEISVDRVYTNKPLTFSQPR